MKLYARHKRWIILFTLYACCHVAMTSWLNKQPLSTLPDNIDHVVAACQEDNLFLQCRNRYNKIVIQDTFYGRHNTFTCASKLLDTSKTCSEPTPRSIVQKVHLMCSGENKCKIPVTSEFLEKKGEEICTDVRKYLKVTYACHQNPHLHMICHNDCSNACWPSCEQSCCNPATPLAAQHPPVITCPGACSNQCAPLCSPTCCASNSLVGTAYQPSVCPATCANQCAPFCQPSCCQSYPPATNAFDFVQPRPKLQYQSQLSNSIPISGVLKVPATTCSGGCPNSCAPQCHQTCCQGTPPPSVQYQPPPPPMLPLPPVSQFTPPTCQGGCPQQCQPLCQPACCQSQIAMQQQMARVPVQPTCKGGCANQCAPVCSQACCEGFSMPTTPFVGVAPLVQTQPSLVMVPQMLQPPPPPPPVQLPSRCPAGCSAGCQSFCPPRCCVPRPYSKNLQQRQSYQQMLTHFRTKQLQRYYQGR